jgi:tetratricopeptide (TPR) repeat protein
MPLRRLSLLALAVLTFGARLPAANDAKTPSPAAPPASSAASTSALGAPPAPAAAPVVTPAPAPPPAAALPAEVVQRATARLKELVARQDTLLAAAAKPEADMDNIKRDLQTLMFDYDDFLSVYRTFAPGYVTYGLLLGKIGMRRESSVILLKANQLDPEIPIVKNQLGNYLAEEGQPVEAANYFIAAVRLAPNEALYHYQLGNLLAEARDDFLKSGHWTRAQIDQAMRTAFQRATELSPGNFPYAYRYAECFYDLSEPDWDQALKVWGALEDQVDAGAQKETIRLHATNILIKQGKFEHARLLLATITSENLTTQKQKLLDQLAAAEKK